VKLTASFASGISEYNMRIPCFKCDLQYPVSVLILPIEEERKHGILSNGRCHMDDYWVATILRLGGGVSNETVYGEPV
jgi:hypothetical protein